MTHPPSESFPTHRPGDLPEDWQALLVQQTAVLATLVARLQTAAGTSPLPPAQVQALVRHADCACTAVLIGV